MLPTVGREVVLKGWKYSGLFTQVHHVNGKLLRTSSISMNNPCKTRSLMNISLNNGFSHLQSLNKTQRFYSGNAPTSANVIGGGGKDGENKIKSVLGKAFPKSNSIIVEDISGGCGSMYQVYVESSEFNGLTIVKQHQLVNKALQDEIKGMHGIRIQTEVPRK